MAGNTALHRSTCIVRISLKHLLPEYHIFPGRNDIINRKMIHRIKYEPFSSERYGKPLPEKLIRIFSRLTLNYFP